MTSSDILRDHAKSLKQQGGPAKELERMMYLWVDFKLRVHNG
jgi:hypothetical protein